MPHWEKRTALLILAFLMSFGGGCLAHADDGSTLQKIRKAGVIAIGYRDAAVPFSYLSAEQKAVGFSLDLCRLVVEKVKQRLRLSNVRIEFRPVTLASRVAQLKAGEIDIDCSGALDTADLRRDVTVSTPIYASQFRWLVQKAAAQKEAGGRKKTPTSIDDLLGRVIVLMKGSAAGSLVLNLSVERFLGLSILNAKDPAAALKLVEAGHADAYMDDDVTLLGVKANAQKPDSLVFLAESFPGPSYVLVMRKDDNTFEGLVNAALADSKRSGDYPKLYQKWFESPIPPKAVNLNYAMTGSVKQLIAEPALVESDSIGLPQPDR